MSDPIDRVLRANESLSQNDASKWDTFTGFWPEMAVWGGDPDPADACTCSACTEYTDAYTSTWPAAPKIKGP